MRVTAHKTTIDVEIYNRMSVDVKAKRTHVFFQRKLLNGRHEFRQEREIDMARLRCDPVGQ